LIAEVDARGSDSKGLVTLRWSLPAGTEIIEADPPLNALGEASLGSIKSGENAISRLVVRFFAPPGALRFGFQVNDGQRILTGYENRTIESSALLLEPLFNGATLIDGRIPTRISNRSNRRRLNRIRMKLSLQSRVTLPRSCVLFLLLSVSSLQVSRIQRPLSRSVHQRGTPHAST
jgi:hypothetical protein